MCHIIGASGHAKVIIEILESQGIRITGITDSNPEISNLLGYSVSTEMPGEEDGESRRFIVSIGNNRIRKQVSEGNDLNYTTAIHPSANLSKRISVGKGSVIMAGATINSGTEISEHCIINTNSSVDHDCKIDRFVHLSPNSVLAGNVLVGEGTHIGIGAAVIQGISIGRWVTIGAGATVIRDIPDYAVVVGVPGKILKYNKRDEG